MEFKVKKDSNLEKAIENAFYSRTLAIERIVEIIQEHIPNGDILYGFNGENTLRYVEYKSFWLVDFFTKYKKDVPKDVSQSRIGKVDGGYTWSVYDGKTSAKILNEIGSISQKSEMENILREMNVPVNLKLWSDDYFCIYNNSEKYTVYLAEDCFKYFDKSDLSGDLIEITENNFA
ncbi:hypothetical protein MMKA1_08360 [Methanococcus maripaludis KA1]|jgi:hypothetical protein|uniref:Uncharacterized protein n=1 Tax=Methanococcus maripaludis KA1 TaxID=637914 RepID=A0A2Z5PFE0_METMI|nr:hypothetical protein [Methanococcus maripaludis]BAP60953.1 hypothetical protein MMKA1_08360 [Methanococcus maripaludis KA1]